MILSGRQIAEQIRQKSIVVDPYNPANVGPNSINLTLHNTLLRYIDDQLDMAARNSTEELTIPPEGFLLQPGELYLGRTVETTKTNEYVPMIEGRSSVGRLGIFVHVTAGFGDIGFDGTWTLEITVVKPTLIRPFVPICQLYFHTIEGEYDLYKSKKYQGQQQIISSRLWKDIVRVPSLDFFDTACQFYTEMYPLITSMYPGPFEFEIAVHDGAVGDEDLKPYVFTQSHVKGNYPTQAIGELYAELPVCLNQARFSMTCKQTGHSLCRHYDLESS